MNAAQYILIFGVRLYRWVISPAKTFVFGPLSQCRFTPSCSQYALEALARHGALRGSWLALKRLGRCQPWGGCGEDPVPDVKPEIRMPKSEGRAKGEFRNSKGGRRANSEIRREPSAKATFSSGFPQACLYPEGIVSLSPGLRASAALVGKPKKHFAVKGFQPQLLSAFGFWFSSFFRISALALRGSHRH